MSLTGMVYRSPYEANSLLLQVTQGYSHNKCTFGQLLDEQERLIGGLDLKIGWKLRCSYGVFACISALISLDLASLSLRKIALKCRQIHSKLHLPAFRNTL